MDRGQNLNKWGEYFKWIVNRLIFNEYFLYFTTYIAFNPPVIFIDRL